MINQRTFFTVFICFVLSFSIFTVDVYASSNKNVPVDIVISSSPSLTVSATDMGVLHTETLNSTGSLTNVYTCYYNYKFVDYISCSFIDVSDPSRRVFLADGIYRVYYVVDYSFTLSWGSSSSYLNPYFHGGTIEVTSPYRDLNCTVRNIVWPTYSNPVGSFSVLYSGNVLVSTYGALPQSKVSIVLPAISTKVFDSVVPNPLPPAVPIVTFKPSFSLGSDTRYFAYFYSSDVNDVNAINSLEDTIKQQHQEEIDKANDATSDVTGGVGQLTDTLSTWEIITMPFNLVKNFAQAIAGDGSSALTFPSFSMMGYQIWPSYTFDLQTVASSFPVLYNGLHLVSGTVVVTGFVRYLWRKWSLLVGDDMPEGSDSS